jgi:hypothetical protein
MSRREALSKAMLCLRSSSSKARRQLPVYAVRYYGRHLAPASAGTVGSALGTSIALAAILSMAGCFAGLVQAPMTAFVIILEMTGAHQAVTPITAVSMIDYVTSRILWREPLCHGLSRVFIAAAIRAQRAAERAASRRDFLADFARIPARGALGSGLRFTTDGSSVGKRRTLTAKVALAGLGVVSNDTFAVQTAPASSSIVHFAF